MDRGESRFDRPGQLKVDEHEPRSRTHSPTERLTSDGLHEVTRLRQKLCKDKRGATGLSRVDEVTQYASRSDLKIGIDDRREFRRTARSPVVEPLTVRVARFDLETQPAAALEPAQEIERTIRRA